MQKNKTQLIRDGLLIGIVVLVVGIIYIVSLLNQKTGEIAFVKYNNKTLFSVSLSNGEFTASTTVYEVEFMPEIKEGKLYINGVIDERLEKGTGVIVYESKYVILGNLDYILIEYKNNKVRVMEETSPYNICSNQGASNNAPIICLPNLVTISFGKTDEVDVII